MIADPTDYLIELVKPRKGQRGYPNIVYRIKHWMQDIKRYEFLGDYLRTSDVNRLLREFGVDPDRVAVVDLLED